MKMKFQFEAEDNRNIMWAESEDGFRLSASVEVPEDASEDYGYLAMKKAICKELAMREIPKDEISFWYDGQEQFLAHDAFANATVTIDVCD